MTDSSVRKFAAARAGSKQARRLRRGAAALAAIGLWMLSPAVLARDAPRVPPRSGQVEFQPEDKIIVQTWPEYETILSAPMAGTIVRLSNSLGSAFEKGETLAEFECTEAKAREQMAEAELNIANENLAAKLRMKSLDAASDIEVSSAAAVVAKSEGQFKLSSHQAGLCIVRAPFQGFVVRAPGKPHQTVAAGTPLLEIVSAATPKLRLSAHSRLIPKLKVGTRLNVTIDETVQTYAATVSAVNARIDPVNQSFELEARVTGRSAGLLPGMSGTASIVPGAAR